MSKKVCSNCGEINNENAVSCISCGKSLINDSTVQVPPYNNSASNQSQEAVALNEIKELLRENNKIEKQNERNINAIKNIAVFFVILVIAGIVLGVIQQVKANKLQSEINDSIQSYSSNYNYLD